MNVTVAIAEDDSVLREILAMALKRKGYRVLVKAVNGRDLLRQLQDAKELPGICVTDLHMPEMNAFEMIPVLRRRYQGMKIIVFSTCDDSNTVNRLYECGADAFVSKTLSVHDYIEALVACMRTTLNLA